MAPPPRTQHPVPDRHVAVALLNRYGALLSERQRDFAHKHLIQNRKFADIAREAGVSRQAVFDAVRKALAQLEGIGAKINETNSSQLHGAGADPTARLENLRRRIASQGIIYSTDWIVRELAEIRDSLKGPSSP